jgi:hypothetical protein
MADIKITYTETQFWIDVLFECGDRKETGAIIKWDGVDGKWFEFVGLDVGVPPSQSLPDLHKAIHEAAQRWFNPEGDE